MSAEAPVPVKDAAQVKRQQQQQQVPSKRVPIIVNEIVEDHSIRRQGGAVKRYRRGELLGKGGFAKCWEVSREREKERESEMDGAEVVRDALLFFVSYMSFCCLYSHTHFALPLPSPLFTDDIVRQ
jgi:hypothetical protein